MKNEWGAELDRNGYAPSIVQADTSKCFLCQRSGVPLVPVFIGRDKRLFHRVSIIIGKPYDPVYTGRKGTAEEYQSNAEEIMRRAYALGGIQWQR